MSFKRLLVGAGLAAASALSLAACEASVATSLSPTGATAVSGGVSAVNADGSTLKATAPFAVFPLADATGIPVEAILTATAGRGVFIVTTLSHRFQVSDSDTFATLLVNGLGSPDAQGLIRYTVDPVLPAGKKVYWRVRSEYNDQAGPWSNVMSFTTAGSAPTPQPTTPTGGSRTPDPAPGTNLPLPNMYNVVLQFSNASDSCPRGIKYVNNPWLDRVIDRFRQDDTRWGYNAKPTRTAADNGGVAVVAAGDEAAYHFSAGADEGSTQVHLVDLLVGHCGSSPTVGWRVFTGEEPGRWTGAGRF